MNHTDKIVASSTSTEYGFRIEARVITEYPAQPVELPDGILTEKWRFVDIVKLGIKLPPPTLFCNFAHDGLVRYPTAMAAAWGLVDMFQNRCVQARVVKYELVTTRKLTQMSVVRPRNPETIFDQSCEDVPAASP